MAAGKRVCIIGAGPSGMSAILHFKRMEEAGDAVPEVICYEKQHNWGGLWNYDWRTSLDEYGEKVAGSMYRHLWSNGPKEALEYGDYTFVEHFKRPISSFPPRTALFDYLEGRWRKFGLTNRVTYNHSVQMVKYDEVTRKFTVTVRDRAADQLRDELFDYVIVGSGHFSTPALPNDIPDLIKFPGRLMHSHEFRDGVQFKGQRVLVVGGSYSAEDLALQTYKFGAKSVTISYRSKPMNFKWPAGIEEHPIITKIEGNKVTFKDGYQTEVDAIILCTGFIFDCQFMDNNLRLTGRNVCYPLNCYKGLVWQPSANNQLFYIGFVDQYYSYTLSDLATLYAVQLIMGKKTLPSSDVMDADWRKWRARCDALKNCHEDIDFQTDYLKDLKQLTGYEHEVDASAAFHQWEDDKVDNILTYRNQTHFKSIHDGTPAAPQARPWLEALDESIASFLGEQ